MGAGGSRDANAGSGFCGSDTIILDDEPTAASPPTLPSAASGGGGGGAGGAGGASSSSFSATADASLPSFERELRTNMQRLIVYAQSSDASLQRMVAERLANECVREDRRRLIVELDGLALLLPLARARCAETRRMAAHALANLSVETGNQRALVERGALSLEGLITHSFDPGRARQAYEVAFDDPQCLKMMIDWQA